MTLYSAVPVFLPGRRVGDIARGQRLLGRFRPDAPPALENIEDLLAWMNVPVRTRPVLKPNNRQPDALFMSGHHHFFKPGRTRKCSTLSYFRFPTANNLHDSPFPMTSLHLYLCFSSNLALSSIVDKEIINQMEYPPFPVLAVCHTDYERL
jgi:hypothetical protein